MPRIAVIADFLEERWPSMDLAAEELATHLSQLDGVQCELVRPPLRFTTRKQQPGPLQRALGRFVQLPIELAVARPKADYFHIADHSYAHIALLFPSDQVGVYCHDVDAFRALLPGSDAPRPRVLLSKLLLSGLRHARLVFYSTQAVRNEIAELGLVRESRLVQAPLGVASEFLAPIAPGIARRRYILHVGSCIPRKNVDFLLEVFAAIRARSTELELVQIGGQWTDRQQRFIDQNQLRTNIVQRRGLLRTELATLYAGADVVLLPSLAEGFGFPIIEAVACGAPVVASDIPVLREVGFEGVRFCSIGNLDEWVSAIEDMRGARTGIAGEARKNIQTRYTWRAHADRIANAYARSPQSAGSR